MFRLLPPAGESSSTTSNGHGSDTAGTMRRRKEQEADNDADLFTPRAPSTLRIHLLASLGEFFGTFMFLFFAFTLHMATISPLPPEKPPTALVILTICFAYAFFYGFWLLIYALTLPGVSPGMFNPVISLGLVLAGALPAFRAMLLLPMQVLAGVGAAAVVKAIVPGDMRRVEARLAMEVTMVQGLFLEMFTTSLIVIAALVLVAKTRTLSLLAPLGMGIALFAASFAGIGYTGASMNPVRALAPCAVSADFPEYHWVYWAGPILGALLPGLYFKYTDSLRRTSVSQQHGAGALPPGKDGEVDPRGAIEERTSMLPQAPTPPKIRKTVITEVRSSRSPGGRSGSGDFHWDKEDGFEVWATNGSRSPAMSPARLPARSPTRSPYRSSREERRGSSGRHSDVSRYARSRDLEEVMR